MAKKKQVMVWFNNFLPSNADDADLGLMQKMKALAADQTVHMLFTSSQDNAQNCDSKMLDLKSLLKIQCQAQKLGREFDVHGRFTFWLERKDMAGKYSEALGYCVLLRSVTYGPMYPNS
eukprot:312519-Rhodomonas_salina.1